MTEVVGGPRSIPGWLAERLGKSTTRDGDPEDNQYLKDDGQTVTNPVKTVHSIFKKGMQSQFK